MIKPCVAVIFDFDGVLVDSLPVHVRAWDKGAEALFGKGLPDDLREVIVGKQTRKISELINQRLGRTDIDGLMREKARQVIALSKEVKLMPGALEFIRFIESRKIPYGIASNAPRDFVHGVCAANDLHLNVKLGVEDATRPKPAPDLFLRCALLLNVPFTSHAECVVFEDSLHGIEAALDAGMKPAGITTHHSDEELAATGALFTSSTLAHFIDHPLIVGA